MTNDEPGLMPLPPSGVRYALTVPQSVLFADLSLRGSTRSIFRSVMRIDYEPEFISIDDGAMSWAYGLDEPFVGRLGAGEAVTVAVARFVTTMGATSRNLDRIARLVGPRSGRRPGSSVDIIEDLRSLWTAYEHQMATLFTFWNVEEALSDSLGKALRASPGSRQALADFLVPAETNFFALERRNLNRLARRFPTDGEGAAVPAQAHLGYFGFLLTPFNLGSPPPTATVLERFAETLESAVEDIVTYDPPWDFNHEPSLRELGSLARQFAYWKSERLDVMSLADSFVHELYEDASELLAIDLDAMFAMRRDELEMSLVEGRVIVDESVLRARMTGYNLTLADGRIDFYQVTTSREDAGEQPLVTGGQLGGDPASGGKATGRVRILPVDGPFDTLEPGEVLVTAMTRPEMGVALDRAAAFVTDEGGRLSHAAIISREMGKPCVIGTGSASRRLRDRMLVEVDGDVGMVTILDDSLVVD